MKTQSEIQILIDVFQDNYDNLNNSDSVRLAAKYQLDMLKWVLMPSKEKAN